MLVGFSLPYRLLPWLLVTPKFVRLGVSLALFASFFAFSIASSDGFSVASSDLSVSSFISSRLFCRLDFFFFFRFLGLFPVASVVAYWVAY